MNDRAELHTGRLLMRRWREADRAPFAALNADPRVMERFPRTLAREESDRMIERIEDHFERHGYGLWALESRDSGELLGFAGLNVVPSRLAFSPAVEVGWRLRHAAWGNGYASEAARASLAVGFRDARLAEIVSFTSVANERSRAVMARIGMRRDRSADFDHPCLAPESPLRRHVLYRLSAEDWAQREQA